MRIPNFRSFRSNVPNMDSLAGHNRMTILYIIYFAVAAIEVAAEYFSYTPVIVVLKPLIPLMLIGFYHLASTKREVLFYLAMLFSVITNLLFIPNSATWLLFGVIAFMIHRLFIISLIIKIIKIRDFIPAVLATIPLLVVFCYLLSITTEIPEVSFYLLIVQNVLISVLGGLALSTYLVNDSKGNSWLLICGLLFVALQFIVFIERYYLSGFSLQILRPIAMALNAFAFFTFYKFVLASEISDNDGAAV